MGEETVDICFIKDRFASAGKKRKKTNGDDEKREEKTKCESEKGEIFQPRGPGKIIRRNSPNRGGGGGKKITMASSVKKV